MIKFTDEQIVAAIEAEVADWSRGWDETDVEALEARRRFHRANVGAGHLGVLKLYLGVYPVLAYRLEEALESLKKLAKKAERYGTPRITWTLGEAYEEERRTMEGRKYKVQMVDVAIDGLAAPKVGDFTFIAKAEITDAGVIVDCVPGETLPAGSREKLATGACEHCGNNRQRRHVFVCRDASGQLVQVGHTCLRDYMGTDTPASVAARFRFERELKEFDEEWGGRSGSFPDSALELLAVTSAAIRLWGWVPKSAPESAGEPTAFRVGVWFRRGYIKEGSAEWHDLKALEKAVGEEDYAMAQAAMDWVASEEAGDSEYAENLRVILAPGAVEAKRRGYACSAVSSYQRHLGRLEERRREKETAAESQHIGKEGERLRGLKVWLVSSRGIGGYYGDTILYKFKDEAGNILTWFSSGGAELEIGKEYVLDATVKAHGEYNGVKETQLTRGKVK